MGKQENIVEFKGRVVRCTYESEDYRAYALDIDRQIFPNIKLTKYGNAVICGNLHKLADGIEYLVKAIEEHTKHGYSYKVINIKRDKPSNEYDMQIFLSEILTPTQVYSLYNAYPDIVDRITSNNLDDIDLSKTKGIKEYTFNVIKKKVIENFVFVDIITEFQGLLNLSMVKRLYETYPSIQTIKNKLKNEPYKCLCGISRVGFKTADSLILEIDKTSKELKQQGKKPIIDFEFDLLTSPQRCLACVLYLLEENENSGNTKMDLVELRNQCVKFTPACSDHFVNIIKHKDIYYNVKNREIALMSTYETEKYIADSVLEKNNQKDIWNIETSFFDNVDGNKLTDEQMSLLKCVCENNIVICTAPAGCGKSFSTKAVINMLKANNKTFSLCSPTGKASKRLSQCTGEQATTIHRLLGYNNGTFMFNEENKLFKDFILIDEAGMCDIKLFYHLTKAVDNRTKILIMGDFFQISSVGCGALLRDLYSYNSIPHVEFNKVFRMGVGGVLTACTNVRNKENYLKDNKVTILGLDKSYIFIPSNDESIKNNVYLTYKKLLGSNVNPSDITVISSYKKGDIGTIALNKLLQPIANPNFANNKNIITITQNKEKIIYCEGDSVIQNSNNYNAKLKTPCYDENNVLIDKCLIANGEQGIIEEINDNKIVINFDETLIVYDRNELKDIMHSFAVTTHKMQGSQNKIIIFCMPKSHMYFLNNNLVYTAISRAEEKVIHFGDINTFKICIQKSENIKRQTMLLDMLNGGENNK